MQARATDMKNFVEMKVANRFDQAGQHKAKGKNESGTVMGATETNQRVRRIAKAEKRAANLKIKVSLVAAGDVSVAQDRNSRQEQDRGERNAHNPGQGMPVPETFDDFGPT